MEKEIIRDNSENENNDNVLNEKVSESEKRLDDLNNYNDNNTETPKMPSIIIKNCDKRVSFEDNRKYDINTELENKKVPLEINLIKDYNNNVINLKNVGFNMNKISESSKNETVNGRDDDKREIEESVSDLINGVVDVQNDKRIDERSDKRSDGKENEDDSSRKNKHAEMCECQRCCEERNVEYVVWHKMNDETNSIQVSSPISKTSSSMKNICPSFVPSSSPPSSLLVTPPSSSPLVTLPPSSPLSKLPLSFFPSSFQQSLPQQSSRSSSSSTPPLSLLPLSLTPLSPLQPSSSLTSSFSPPHSSSLPLPPSLDRLSLTEFQCNIGDVFITHPQIHFPPKQTSPLKNLSIVNEVTRNLDSSSVLEEETDEKGMNKNKNHINYEIDEKINKGFDINQNLRFNYNNPNDKSRVNNNPHDKISHSDIITYLDKDNNDTTNTNTTHLLKNLPKSMKQIKFSNPFKRTKNNAINSNNHLNNNSSSSSYTNRFSSSSSSSSPLSTNSSAFEEFNNSNNSINASINNESVINNNNTYKNNDNLNKLINNSTNSLKQIKNKRKPKFSSSNNSFRNFSGSIAEEENINYNDNPIVSNNNKDNVQNEDSIQKVYNEDISSIENNKFGVYNTKEISNDNINNNNNSFKLPFITKYRRNKKDLTINAKIIGFDGLDNIKKMSPSAEKELNDTISYLHQINKFKGNSTANNNGDNNNSNNEINNNFNNNRNSDSSPKSPMSSNINGRFFKFPLNKTPSVLSKNYSVSSNNSSSKENNNTQNKFNDNTSLAYKQVNNTSYKNPSCDYNNNIINKNDNPVKRQYIRQVSLDTYNKPNYRNKNINNKNTLNENSNRSTGRHFSFGNDHFKNQNPCCNHLSKSSGSMEIIKRKNQLSVYEDGTIENNNGRNNIVRNNFVPRSRVSNIESNDCMSENYFHVPNSLRSSSSHKSLVNRCSVLSNTSKSSVGSGEINSERGLKKSSNLNVSGYKSSRNNKMSSSSSKSSKKHKKRKDKKQKNKKFYMKRSNKFSKRFNIYNKKNKNFKKKTYTKTLEHLLEYLKLNSNILYTSTLRQDKRTRISSKPFVQNPFLLHHKITTPEKFLENSASSNSGDTLVPEDLKYEQRDTKLDTQSEFENNKPKNENSPDSISSSVIKDIGDKASLKNIGSKQKTKEFMKVPKLPPRAPIRSNTLKSNKQNSNSPFIDKSNDNLKKSSNVSMPGNVEIDGVSSIWNQIKDIEKLRHQNDYPTQPLNRNFQNQQQYHQQNIIQLNSTYDQKHFYNENLKHPTSPIGKQQLHNLEELEKHHQQQLQNIQSLLRSTSTTYNRVQVSGQSLNSDDTNSEELEEQDDKNETIVGSGVSYEQMMEGALDHLNTKFPKSSQAIMNY